MFFLENCGQIRKDEQYVLWNSPSQHSSAHSIIGSYSKRTLRMYRRRTIPWLVIINYRFEMWRRPNRHLIFSQNRYPPRKKISLIYTALLPWFRIVTFQSLVVKIVCGYLFSGESGPDVYITVAPPSPIQPLSPISVSCDADVAMVPFETPKSPPQPPTTIMMHIGIYMVKVCDNGGFPINKCVYNLESFFPELPRTISCTAVNNIGECRFKTAVIEFLPISGWLQVCVP